MNLTLDKRFITRSGAAEIGELRRMSACISYIWAATASEQRELEQIGWRPSSAIRRADPGKYGVLMEWGGEGEPHIPESYVDARGAERLPQEGK